MHFHFDNNLVDRRYILDRQIGKGGMGAVYEAYDRLTGETVALKLVLTPPRDLDFSTRGGDLDLHIALAQEFKTLASLRHPNIISVLNYGFDEQKRPYFTMDLLEDAQSPARAVWGKPAEYKVEVLVAILQALSYLHRRNIIHRDLKPANVRIEKGQVKVLDFGLSILKTQNQQDSDKIVGTIEYMAPELLRQKPPSIESDLYAVGVVGWELFTGEYLFDSTDIRQVADEIFHKIPDPSVIGHDRVAAVLSRLLAKDPADRYASADETITALCNAANIPIPEETIAIRESFLTAAALVGRDEELEQLSTMLNQAKQGQGSGILIAGESGVGKSRLLDELRVLALVDGMVVMRGEGISAGRSPYQIWRDIIRVLVLGSEVDRRDAGVLEPLIPDIEKLLEMKVITPEELDPQASQKRLISVIEKLFRSHQRPILLILEDLHWSGIESLALLYRLNQIVAELPLLIVASYRDDEAPDLPSVFKDVPVLKLARLQGNEIEALAVAMLGEGGRQPEFIRLIERETEGNVFFIVEVMRALAEEAGKLDSIITMSLPTHVFTGGVEKIIQRRLSRIPDYIRPIIELAAVGGRYIDMRVLGYFVQDEKELETMLSIASNAAVLDLEGGLWRFAHEKLRESLIKSLQPTENAQLHGQFADAIENVYIYVNDKFSSLAYHWGQANNHQKEGIYAALAGEQVLNSGAYAEAVHFLTRALELSTEESDVENAKKQGTLTRQLGSAYFGLEEHDQAKQFYQGSLNIFEGVDYKWGIASALSDLGHVNYATHDYEDSYRYFRRAIQTAMSVRAQTVALAGIIGVAKLMATAQRDEWAVELVAMTLDHVAVDQQTANRAQELLTELQTKLASDVFEAARQRGQNKRLSEIVEELIAQ